MLVRTVKWEARREESEEPPAVKEATGPEAREELKTTDDDLVGVLELEKVKEGVGRMEDAFELREREDNVDLDEPVA
ncbi:hypothetical protein HDU98_001599, partial [Podochytrium sp. JEL0797]